MQNRWQQDMKRITRNKINVFPVHSRLLVQLVARSCSLNRSVNHIFVSRKLWSRGINRVDRNCTFYWQLMFAGASMISWGWDMVHYTVKWHCWKRVEKGIGTTTWDTIFCKFGSVRWNQLVWSHSFTLKLNQNKCQLSGIPRWWHDTRKV